MVFGELLKHNLRRAVARSKLVNNSPTYHLLTDLHTAFECLLLFQLLFE